MARVVGVNHLVTRVSYLQASRDFYSRLLSFLGFEVLEDYGEMIGWANQKTRFWIRSAGPGAKPHRGGGVGLHHYAFDLRSRSEVDDLQAFLDAGGARILDPAAEYYDDYYVVFFLDPDRMKLEGMKYGERMQAVTP